MEWYHVWWPLLTSKRLARFVSDSWVSRYCFVVFVLCMCAFVSDFWRIKIHIEMVRTDSYTRRVQRREARSASWHYSMTTVCVTRQWYQRSGLTWWSSVVTRHLYARCSSSLISRHQVYSWRSSVVTCTPGVCAAGRQQSGRPGSTSSLNILCSVSGRTSRGVSWPCVWRRKRDCLTTTSHDNGTLSTPSSSSASRLPHLLCRFMSACYFVLVVEIIIIWWHALDR